MRSLLIPVAIALIPALSLAQSGEILITAKESPNCQNNLPYCFDPSTVEVDPQSEVTLRFDNPSVNNAPHNLHVRSPVEKRTPLRGPGESQINDTLTFVAPASGTISFVCDVHPDMVGKIVVRGTTTEGNSKTPLPVGILLGASLVGALVLSRRRG